MYLEVHYVLENFRHLKLITSKLHYQIKRLHTSTPFPHPASQGIPICGCSEESYQCRLKYRPRKGHLSHRSFSRTWSITETSSADDMYEEVLSSVLHILGFLLLKTHDYSCGMEIA